MEPVSFQIKGCTIKISRCREAYFPSDDTMLLADSIVPRGKCLEIGCGSGLASIMIAKMGFSILSSDINPEAVKCTEGNASLNGVKIKTVCCDLFSGIEGSFDTVIFNPPYLPGETYEEKVKGSEMWYGGEDGLQTARKFLSELGKHLNRGGKCYIILSSLTDIDGLQREFKQYEFQRLAEKKIFMETIYAYSLSPS
jgi:release factor glutamine methyltransferase